VKYLEVLRAQHEALVEQRSAALVEMEAATAGAVDEQRSALTDVEAASFEEARGRVDQLDSEIAEIAGRIGELNALAERQVAAAAVPETVHYMRKADDADTLDRDVAYLRPAEARSIALATIERKDELGLASEQLDKLDRLIRSQTGDCRGDVVAKRLIVTENDHYRSAWQKAITSPTPVFTADEARAIQAWDEFRAASIGTDTAGGFGVPVLIDPTIILTGQQTLNPFRQIATVRTITTDEWKGVTSAGVSWSFDAEAAEVSDDAPTLAQPTVTAHMARGFIPYSIEIGGDYPGFANEMSMLLAAGLDELESSAFATGTGSNQPFGILTALDANTNVEVALTTDGSFSAADVRKVWSALPDRARANATWVMSSDVANDISAFGSSYGADSTVDLTGQVETLKSRPVVISSYFPDFTGATAAQNVLVVGDFRKYYIVDRVGLTVELIPHLFNTGNNRPSGQRGWFAYKRVGADSVDDASFRLLQQT
jgi:HK97 family phage major capsid protein